MRHQKLLFLHPVLRPGGFDYDEKCSFEMTVEESKRTAEGVVRIRAALNLVSDTLNKLIKEKRCKFLVMVQCTRTYYRRTISSPMPNIVLEIPAGDIAGTLHLTPYVVASDNLDWLNSDEHADEIKNTEIRNRIPIGSILAVGASYEVELDNIGTIQSAIKIQRNEFVDEGKYTVNTVEDFVVIELGPKTYVDVAQMRESLRELLYPSIYQAAIEYAIRKMGDDPDRKWAKALRKTLDDNKINDKEIVENPNHCAQIILDSPLGQMIRRCGRGVVTNG